MPNEPIVTTEVEDFPMPQKPWYDNLPVWIKAAMLIGPTALIALGLTYRIPMQIDSLTAKIEAHTLETASIATDLRIYREAQAKLTEELLRINRQMCVNTARTDEQRLKCF